MIFNTKTDSGWSNKARRRKTTGVGRCAYLKLVKRRESNGFQTGKYFYFTVLITYRPSTKEEGHHHCLNKPLLNKEDLY
jgi:hypothetical protein